ncbi:hypothetical protein EV360DRAFT_72221 [Lentinula raphanica]|nr:hypothetical protein EV360DRAFT_72221 [Lentinula raphanica]
MGWTTKYSQTAEFDILFHNLFKLDLLLSCSIYEQCYEDIKKIDGQILKLHQEGLVGKVFKAIIIGTHCDGPHLVNVGVNINICGPDGSICRWQPEGALDHGKVVANVGTDIAHFAMGNGPSEHDLVIPTRALGIALTISEALNIAQELFFELDGCRVRDASSDCRYPIWKEGTCTVLMVAMQYSTSIKFCFLAVDAPWLATQVAGDTVKESIIMKV